MWAHRSCAQTSGNVCGAERVSLERERERKREKARERGDREREREKPERERERKRERARGRQQDGHGKATFFIANELSDDVSGHACRAKV